MTTGTPVLSDGPIGPTDEAGGVLGVMVRLDVCGTVGQPPSGTGKMTPAWLRYVASAVWSMRTVAYGVAAFPVAWQIATGMLDEITLDGQPVFGIGTMFPAPRYEDSCAAGTVSAEYGAAALPVATQMVTGLTID